MTPEQIVEPAERVTSEQRHRWADYGQAVVHLAWLRDDETRHLLFGMVELLPLEFPDIENSPEHCHRATNKDRLYLYYQRFSMTIEEVISWYEAAIEGRLILPKSDRNTPRLNRTMRSGSFRMSPTWPELVVSNDLGFIPDWMLGARAHFLFPRQHSLSRSHYELLRKPKNNTRLKQWLHLDLVDLYQDYLGAICLIAPNPSFRSIEKTRLDESSNESVEKVAYKLIARANQSLDGVRLEIINQNVFGRLTPNVKVFSDENPIQVFEFIEPLNQEGRTVIHPRHGLILWNDPVPVLRTIQLNIGVESRRKQVDISAHGEHRPNHKYRVSEYQRESSTVFGAKLVNSEIQSRIIEGQHRRARRQKGSSQHWFRDRPSEAAKFIRDVIGSARRFVMIADPYFSAYELLAFGHAIQSQDVELQILSSVLHLKSKDAGYQVQKALDQTFRDYFFMPKVHVLLGNPPPLHDRFLVIDNIVWFSGNSLGTIGKRAGLIVRVPDPEPIIEQLNYLWKEATSLDDWLKERSGSSQIPSSFSD